MKKIILILYSACFTVQFSFGQAAIDTNTNCNKATLINTSDSYIPTYDKFTNTKYESFYSFIAKTTNAKLVLKSKIFIYYVWDGTEPCSLTCCGKANSKGFYSINIPFENLIIGNKYSYKIGKYDEGNFETGVLNINETYKEDLPNSSNAKKIIANIPFNISTSNYTKGRESGFGCKTTKADSNTIDLFVKFKATSTSATLDLNLDNSSLESTLGLISGNFISPCQAIQKNKNLRTDTFTGLTIGNEYTVRIEIGGDAALGYARNATTNNASITLVGGATTGIETVSQPTFSIAPNPSNGSFSFISDENADLEISDLLAAKVAILQNVSPNQIIDLQLAKGFYLLKVTNTKGSKIEKLVIE